MNQVMNRNAVTQGVPQRRNTKWHNPTDRPQTVIIQDGAPFAFTVAPGETSELDSRYDRAVQLIDCGRQDCHKKGWFCTEGHEGLIVGGQAPLLRRAGKSDRMDDSLDPAHATRKELEKQVNEELEKERLLGEMVARRKAMADKAEPEAKKPQASAKA